MFSLSKQNFLTRRRYNNLHLPNRQSEFADCERICVICLAMMLTGGRHMHQQL